MSAQGSTAVQPLLGGQSSERLDECRRLVARRYLAEGYVSPGDIENGFLGVHIDPYVSHSEYFWSVDEHGRTEATIRIVKHPGPQDHQWEFPMQRSFDLSHEDRCRIEQFVAAHPRKVVEISALAEEVGARKWASFSMYRDFWQHAKRTGYEVCLMAADERLHRTLVRLFGIAVVQVGPASMMLGSETVPAILYPGLCAQSISSIYRDLLDDNKVDAATNYRQVIAYLAAGLDARYFRDDEKHDFRSMGIEIR